MSGNETSATLILDADNSRVLAATKQVDQALVASGKASAASASASAAGVAKITRSATEAASSVQKVQSGMSATASAIRQTADQVQGLVGKMSGYLGAAGLVLGAVTAIGVATYEWYQNQVKIDGVTQNIYHLSRKIVAETRDAAGVQAESARLAELAEDRERRGAELRTEEQLSLEHQIAQQEILGGSEVYRNSLKMQALELQLKYENSQISAGAGSWAEVKAIERQIELLGLKSSMAESSPGRGRGGGGSRREVVRSGDASGEFGSEIADRANAVNQRRLSALEAERAQASEIAALRMQGELDLLGVVEGNDAKIHQARMAQIVGEQREQEKALAAREQALRADSSGDALDALQRADEIRQTVHDREMSRLEADLSMRQAVAAESQRIADEQAASLAAQMQTIGEVTSTVESIAGDLSGRLGQFASDRMAQEQAELDTYTARLEQRASAQSASLDREISAARGNAGRMAALQRQKAKLEDETGRSIEKAKAAHAAKADKIERIQKGGAMLLEGGLATVRAATSYPNIPQMVALAAAAALAFSFGAMTLAGGTPGAGGGGGSLAGLGSSGSGGSSPQFSEAARTPGSLGSSVPAGPRLAQTSNASGGVVYNGPVNYYTTGSIDRAAAEAYALEAGKVARSREGAGRT